ncbi:MAG: M48 family metallopeptidase, partial [Chloroflexi bacterium]|nr:M48 family metallopeptidase [Chloroflexota bacterium]
WIMPLFNKFNPLPEGELKEAIMSYTGSVGYKVNKIFVMDASKRSTKSNAFFTGFGRNKRIVLFDTLIEKHTVPELVGVLAHEVGHYKKKHILIGMIVGIIHTGIIFFLISVFLTSSGIFQAFGVEQQSVYTGLLFFGFLYAPVELFLSVIFNAISRRNEKSADLFAVCTTQQPKAMIDALKKLTATNLSNLRPHPLYVFLYYSHPPVLERIADIQKYQTEQEIKGSMQQSGL